MRIVVGVVVPLGLAEVDPVAGPVGVVALVALLVLLPLVVLAVEAGLLDPSTNV
jgi:hypothetical protein